MVVGRPDCESVDVLVDGDVIVGVGAGLNIDSDDVEIVDCRDRIIMPGLVNAHLHTWQTGLRTIGSNWTLAQYLANSHGNIARHVKPADMKIAALAGALGQLNSGTTTIGDWCHNNPTPEHTDAALEGLLQSGVRSVFMHGTPYTKRGKNKSSEVDRLLDGPARQHELLTIGMAIRGPQLSPASVAEAEMRAARDREVIVSMHQSGGVPKPAWDSVYRAGLYGPSTNIVHGAGLTGGWISRLVDAGVTFSVTPENELGQGHGSPIIGDLLALDDAPSLGTDTDCVIAGDVLTAARVALAYQRGADHDRHRDQVGIFSRLPTVTGKQALSWVTVEGARALGLGHRIGRVQIGMQADLVVIDSTALNLWPAHDPIAAALNSSFGNVESVMVAGAWRKRNHVLVGVDLESVKTEIAESGRRIVEKFREPGVLGGVRQRIVDKVVDRRLMGDMVVPPD